MRKPVRACLPDTVAALPKGKLPVISDGCPWQQLKHTHPPKQEGGGGEGVGGRRRARAGSWLLPLVGTWAY